MVPAIYCVVAGSTETRVRRKRAWWPGPPKRSTPSGTECALRERLPQGAVHPLRTAPCGTHRSPL